MKAYRAIIVYIYVFLTAPFVFFSMLLASDYGLWDKIQAFAIIVVSGVVGTVLLRLLNKEKQLTGGVQIGAAIGDILILIGAFVTVISSLKQSHIVVADLICSYAVMAAFIALRVWDFIYIDKCLTNAEKERLEQSDENK